MAANGHRNEDKRILRAGVLSPLPFPLFLLLCLPSLPPPFFPPPPFSLIINPTIQANEITGFGNKYYHVKSLSRLKRPQLDMSSKEASAILESVHKKTKVFGCNLENYINVSLEYFYSCVC